MLIKDLNECHEFTAGDKSLLRELLHPGKENIKIRYSLAHAKLKVGEKSKPHKLLTSEVYYILEGEGLMYIDSEKEKVSRNHIVYIPPNSTQYIENIGKTDLNFLCIVDPAWQKKDEVVL